MHRYVITISRAGAVAQYGCTDKKALDKWISGWLNEGYAVQIIKLDKPREIICNVWEREIDKMVKRD